MKAYICRWFIPTTAFLVDFLVETWTVHSYFLVYQGAYNSSLALASLPVYKLSFGTNRIIFLYVNCAHYYISRESSTTRNVLWSRASVCLSVYLSAAACPHYCRDADVTWGVVGDAPSCALYGGFAIGAPGALLWQHNVNAKC